MNNWGTCALLAAVVVFLVAQAGVESHTFNRLTGAETTWWDALWVDLEVQQERKLSEEEQWREDWATRWKRIDTLREQYLREQRANNTITGEGPQDGVRRPVKTTPAK